MRGGRGGGIRGRVLQNQWGRRRGAPALPEQRPAALQEGTPLHIREKHQWRERRSQDLVHSTIPQPKAECRQLPPRAAIARGGPQQHEKLYYSTTMHTGHARAYQHQHGGENRRGGPGKKRNFSSHFCAQFLPSLPQTEFPPPTRPPCSLYRTPALATRSAPLLPAHWLLSNKRSLFHHGHCAGEGRGDRRAAA